MSRLEMDASMRMICIMCGMERWKFRVINFYQLSKTPKGIKANSAKYRAVTKVRFSDGRMDQSVNMMEANDINEIKY